eukprot:CAMPEP_0201511996 /NCGR_PEP_ID=MMETSP0161_2-20130828/4357_1 /ASSEMBLY_ACC=CAM_ASM_000251 /TAXON_ID=180227 /ORGANISM="Neoparamoeba aestuarina, Strain SoJaBio B1-5/56/2" /LENGTH=49 /DNA_ID= /DNA_START= /DNA_END= /DNA_ORIENTATION=
MSEQTLMEILTEGMETRYNIWGKDGNIKDITEWANTVIHPSGKVIKINW